MHKNVCVWPFFPSLLSCDGNTSTPVAGQYPAKQWFRADFTRWGVGCTIQLQHLQQILLSSFSPFKSTA